MCLRGRGKPCTAYGVKIPVLLGARWRVLTGAAKQPYAIAMKDGSPFGIGGIWDTIILLDPGAPGSGPAGHIPPRTPKNELHRCTPPR